MPHVYTYLYFHLYLQTQQQFFEQTCRCSKIYGSQACSGVISVDAAVQYREHCREMEREALESAIKMQLLAHRSCGLSTSGKGHKTKERERPFQTYYFQSKQICRYLLNQKAKPDFI